VIAHVGGVPVEELIPTAAGAGTALLVARTWISLRLRRQFERSPASQSLKETQCVTTRS
jgi:cytochrome oxidase assembly protein ShyY1